MMKPQSKNDDGFFELPVFEIQPSLRIREEPPREVIPRFEM